MRTLCQRLLLQTTAANAGARQGIAALLLRAGRSCFTIHLREADTAAALSSRRRPDSADNRQQAKHWRGGGERFAYASAATSSANGSSRLSSNLRSRRNLVLEERDRARRRVGARGTALP